MHVFVFLVMVVMAAAKSSDGRSQEHRRTETASAELVHFY